MRIAIASPSRLTVEALRRAVTGGAGHEVIWTAREGAQALESTLKDTPDLLLLDPALSQPGAAEVTRQVMAERPCAVLLARDRAAGSVEVVYEALGQGALDAVTAPAMSPDGELTGLAPFLERLVRLEPLLSKRAPASGGSGPIELREPAGAAPIVAIGSSAGGPAALASILVRVPRDLAAAVLIVQHIDDGFAEGLASWLTERTGFRVSAARSGDVPRTAQGYLAATAEHLVLRPDRSLGYSAEPSGVPHRPSIDVLFGSLAASPSPGLGILLTGMGRDGAEGLLRLRRAGWTTVAQDARTSVVYGMPRAAAELNAAELILPLDAIPATIAGFAARQIRRRGA